MSAGGEPDDAVVQEPEGHEDLRTAFHHALDEIREAAAKLAAGVTENIPRATEILLRQDLEDFVDVVFPEPFGRAERQLERGALDVVDQDVEVVWIDERPFRGPIEEI